MAIWHNKFSVAPYDSDNITVSDKAKTYMECFSGQNWDWWPLNPPTRPITPNKVRIQWQCVSHLRRGLFDDETDWSQDCGYKRYADCSPALVRKCVRVGKLALESGHRK